MSVRIDECYDVETQEVFFVTLRKIICSSLSLHNFMFNMRFTTYRLQLCIEGEIIDTMHRNRSCSNNICKISSSKLSYLPTYEIMK